MLVTKGDFVRDVRIAMDMNSSDATLVGGGDAETLELDEIIISTAPRAVKEIEMQAPVWALGEGVSISPTIVSSLGGVAITQGLYFSDKKGGNTIVVQAKDFMRLISLKLSDWTVAISEAVDTSHPCYKRQAQRWGGLKAGPGRPLAVIDYDPAHGQLIRTFGSTTDLPHVEVCKYCPLPKWDIASTQMYIGDGVYDECVARTAEIVSGIIGGNQGSESSE